MGFFGRIGEFFEIIVDSAEELGEIVTDFHNDMSELTQQAVRNAVTGSDEELKTSYDVRNEAEEIIATSGRKYQRATEKFEKVWNSMANKSHEVSKERAAVYELFGETIASRQAMKLPSRQSMVYNEPGIPRLDRGAFYPDIWMKHWRPDDVGALRLDIGGAKRRMAAAEDYLDDAHDYRIEVNAAISKMEQGERAARSLSNACTEELEMLRIMRTAYQKQSDAVLSQSQDILREIAILSFKETNDNTTKKYNGLLRKLKELWG